MKTNFLFIVFFFNVFNVFPQTSSNVVVFMNQKNYTQLYGPGADLFCLQTSNSVLISGDKTALGSSYGKSLPNPEDTASWNKIFNYLNWCGFSFIRLGYEHEMIQPLKNVFIWDNPTDFPKESRNYKIMLKILDWAQANKVDVQVQEIGPNAQWLKVSDQDLRYSAPNDYNQWAIGVSGLMDKLVNGLDYSCIKMLSIANEPGGWWSWAGGDILAGYTALKPKLRNYGISVPFVGPDSHSSIGESKITSLYNSSKGYINVFDAHNYDDSKNDMLGSRPASVANITIPAMWTEFGGGDNSGYDWNISLARWQLGCYNNGLDGVSRWSFLNNNDIDGNFSYIQTFDKKNQTLLSKFSRTPNLYYIDGIISRFVAKGSNICTTKSDNIFLTPTLFESPNGNITLVITNNDKSNAAKVKFVLQNLKSNKTLYRYQITEANKDKENVIVSPSNPIQVTLDKSTFTDLLSKNSIYVYSTYCLQSLEMGIVEDGTPISIADWKLPLTDVPLHSNATIFDNTNSNISYNNNWLTKNDENVFDRSLSYTNTTGAYFDFDITGKGFRLYGQQDKYSGTAVVYIDGLMSGYATNFSPLPRNGMMIYESPLLADKKHTIRVICDGSKTVTSLGNYINIDAIGAFSTNAKLSLQSSTESLPSPPQRQVIDKSTGKNILLNPSFESGDNNSWITNISVGLITGITNNFPARWDISSAQSGNYALVLASKQWWSPTFNASVSQAIQNPQEGFYKLRFWARSTGGLTSSEVRITSKAGIFKVKIPQTLNSTWQKVKLDRIKIQGACIFKISSNSNTDRWAAIDNLELFRFEPLKKIK